MLKLNKKIYIAGALSLLGLFLLFLVCRPLEAASAKFYQVKLANNPVVYFLNYATHHKKAYLNANSYLSYNNKWSDIRTVSAKELSSWPDYKLVKTGSSPAIFYINGDKRAKLLSRDDLESFGFLGEAILNISETDLNQYKLVTYQEIGLSADSGTSNSNSSSNSSDSGSAKAIDPVTPPPPETQPSASLGKLLVFNDLVKVSDNTLITNTKNNLMGIFRFQATQNTATITALTFTFSGVFNSALLSDATAQDENNNNYNISTGIRTSDRQIIVYFRDPITINPGAEKTVKIYINFNTCDCNNQTVRLELKQAGDIKTNLTPTASWPLQGTEFKLMVADNLFASLTLQEESLDNAISNSSGRLLGKFTLSETSGKEDAVVKKIVFSNNGSAGTSDLNDFILYNNNQMISRIADFDSDRNIVFNISYLRIPKGGSTSLTVDSSLKSGYNQAATVNLRAVDLSGVGQTYNFSLPIIINNISSGFTLN